jgi:secreted trypsin-like serine protease
MGDEGSPVFSNKTGKLVYVGVVSIFPDMRKNARCKDGHKVVITQLGNYKDFIRDQL